MQFIDLSIKEVILFKPKIYKDERGFFYESFNQVKFEEIINSKSNFVQDNHSKSTFGVLRGLHYQLYPKAQGKLIRVVSGEIFDVAVDIRKKSPSFGQWVGEILSAKNKKQLWVPEGFAHGFLTLSDTAEVLYKTTDYYAPELSQTIKWDDEDININWPLEDFSLSLEKIILSSQDELGKKLSDSKLF